MSKQLISQRPSRVNTLEETPEFDNDLFIGVVNTELNGDTTDWNITLDINETQVKFKFDTGAQCNILPLSTYNLPQKSWGNRVPS